MLCTVWRKRRWVRDEWMLRQSFTQWQLLLEDETVGVAPSKATSSNVVNSGQWHHVIMTYDGGGGGTAMAGVNIYVDGVAVNGSATEQATYVSMANLGRDVVVGGSAGTAWFAGSIAGACNGPAFIPREMTADEAKREFNLGRGPMGV